MADLPLDDNPFWYRDAIIYQLHVKAFSDSNGDGIGDFPGLIGKLDYLQDLGVSAVWLLPFYPSPLKDDGYDISDYFNVHPSYHTLKDFKEFMRAAHSRGIRVITELVLNHTSDQHPWFQRARRSHAGSRYRDYYVWSDKPDKYREARIIFQDFEKSNWAWDPVAQAYYWHRFYSHQPDLNFDNPRVQREMLRVIDFWLSLGVDGMRLDAVPYLYEREGTNCENLPETHTFLKLVRAHIDRSFRNRMLLSEANQWPEDAVSYFGDGDETNMAFHFPLMPRMFMSIMMEDRFPIIDILDQTPAIPENCQWATFLRNHDELTLEMVTDEERDYMYRTYAMDPQARINLGIRRRLAPLMGNNRRRIELMNILLMSLPGTPIIYYGDEIGMGDNYYLGDRDGVRTPMQWSPDRNAGFSRANPHQLYLPVIIDPEYHYEAVNVETQERNSTSLLWWMRRSIALRKRFKAFGRGKLEMLSPDNPKVLAFIRSHEEEKVLVAVNLSRFSQAASIDLSRYAGMIPEELVSSNRFPIIRESPYVFTFGPHDYYWFALRAGEASIEVVTEGPKLKLKEGQNWTDVITGKAGNRFFDTVIPQYLHRVRWYRSKGRVIRQASLLDSYQFRRGDKTYLLLLIHVAYTQDNPETYVLPVSWLPLERVPGIAGESPQAIIAPLFIGEEEGALCDALFEEEFREFVLTLISDRRRLRSESGGELTGTPAGTLRRRTKTMEGLFPVKLLSGEQSNTSLQYGDSFMLKLYRKLEEGVNPEIEIIRFFSERTRFRNVPAYAGGLEFRSDGGQPLILGVVQEFIPSHGDAWKTTLTVLSQLVERLLSLRVTLPDPPAQLPGLLEAAAEELPENYSELMGGFYQQMVGVLGKRTAEMHAALASVTDDPSWAVEEFSTLYQRSIYQSMRSLVRRNLQLLGRMKAKMKEEDQSLAEDVLGAEKEILACLHRITGKRLPAVKCRVHGDFHLGQALFTGKDFVIIDFEGEPARSMSERRLKRSPLIDVAGMIRSFHYAAKVTLGSHGENHPADLPFLEPWLDVWYVYTSGAFLRSYIETLGESNLIPRDRGELDIMLRCFLMEKAVYEVGYELNNRPEWVGVPLRGIEMALQECRAEK
ncbi:maltose alpha-D-glucosyltransferase [Geobacter sp. DSM 9736]|uniref:maltose alpha-D-glucosyltransferase n=1 Tax=Geobacter sp. DSM 9736 TaxID=1277350 RepID=UPI000B506668|nr:maltose alpha-D-glucosyltransferase [Geobacter sp. DSM 9736]SNB47352.1 maltose alpha-D-glucosyltransferase/ alpha-amylase [Geobacter sp. DSM 9736]